MPFAVKAFNADIIYNGNLVFIVETGNWKLEKYKDVDALPNF